MALTMTVCIAALPAGFAFAGRVAPTPAQRRAAYEARRNERLGGQTASEIRAGVTPSAADLLARASAVAARSRRAPEERALALRHAALKLWSEAAQSANPAEAAEAHSRSAALLRANGQEGEALAGYLAACSAEPGGTVAQRAALAAAALMRTQGRFEGALGLLDTVVLQQAPRSGRSSQPQRARRDSIVRDRARYERARTLQQAGRLEAARMAFRQLADETERPLLAVSCFDGWSRVLIEERDLEGAAGVLEACRTKFRGRSFERTETGERLRRALKNMTCIPRLQRAIAQRQALEGVVKSRVREAKDVHSDTVRGDF